MGTPEGLASGMKTRLILQDDSAGLRVLNALDEFGETLHNRLSRLQAKMLSRSTDRDQQSRELFQDF
jgi:hypothetical protein